MAFGFRSGSAGLEAVLFCSTVAREKQKEGVRVILSRPDGRVSRVCNAAAEQQSSSGLWKELGWRNQVWKRKAREWDSDVVQS